MRSTWLVGLAILWLIGTIISMTLEATYIGQEVQYTESGEVVGTVSTLDKLMNPEFDEFTNPFTFIVGVFNIVWDYIGVLWNMLWWNYTFFTGVWSIFKYIGWCISLGLIMSLVLAIRGTSSS